MFTAQFYLGEELIKVSFDVEGSPYIPASYHNPAEGGIDDFVNIFVEGVVIDQFTSSEFSEGEHGCTIKDLELDQDNLSREQIDAMEKAVFEYDPT